MPRRPSIETLFHVTGADALASIRRNGLRGPSYWGQGPVADHYEAVIVDEGRRPVRLAISFDAADGIHLEPDDPGIEVPLKYALGLREADGWRSWQTSAQTWRASLDLIGSLRCRVVIPPRRLLMVEPDGVTRPLVAPTPLVPPRPRAR